MQSPDHPEHPQNTNDDHLQLVEPQIQNNSLARSATMQPVSMIRQQYSIGEKTFIYEGPDHPYIQDLFQLVNERYGESKYSWINSIKEKDKQIQNWFKGKCSFFNGGIEITHYDLFIWFFHIVIFIVFVVFAIDLQSNSEVQANAYKMIIVENLIPFGVFFTLYSLILLMINYTWIKLLLTIIGILVPLWFLLNNYLNIFSFNSQANYDTSMIFVLAFIIITVLNGFLVSQFYVWLKTFMKQLFASLVVNLWCLFAVFLVGYFILEYIIISNQLIFSDMLTYIIGKLYLPLLLILIFSWFILKARLFDWPEDVIQKAIDRLKEMLQKKYIDSQPTQQRVVSWIYLNRIQIISYLIGIFYLVLEIWLFLKLSNTLQNQYDNYNEIMTLAFEVVAVPLYLFLGVFISITNRELSQTFLYIPLFIGAPLIFSFLKLYFYMNSESTITQQMIDSIGDSIYYGPFILFTIWLTISIIGIEKRKLQMYSLCFLCFFLAFPLGVLLPLYYQSTDDLFLYFSYTMLGIGGLILIMILGYFIKLSVNEVWKIKQITEDDFPNFGEYAYYNLTPYGLWMNAIFFMGSIFLLGEFFWFSQELEAQYQPTDVELGTLFSLLIIHPILFFLINQALAGKSLYIKQETDFINVQLEQLDQLENQKKLQALKIQNYTVIIGMITPIVVCIPIAVLSSSDVFQTFLMALGLGLPMVFAIYKILTYIKNQSEQYQNFFASFVSSLLWCCIIFPFGVIVPIMSVQFLNRSEQFQVFAQVAVASGLFICICGVTGTSLFFSILLNKEEFERKKRAVAQGLIEYFYREHVFSDMAVCSLIYMRYLVVGNQIERKIKKENVKKSQLSLQQKESTNKTKESDNPKTQIEKKMVDDLYVNVPVGVIDYNGEDYECNKQLVSKINFDKSKDQALQKRLQEEEELKKKSQQPNKYLVMIWDCLQCKCGLQELVDLENQKQEEILELRDIYKMDEKQGLIMDVLIPGFTDIYKLQDSERTGLLDRLDLDPIANIIKNKQDHKNVEEIVSTKTEKLKSLKREKVSDKAINKIRTQDYYKSLEEENNLFPQFMHEVFMEFSNEDENLPPSICYNDFQEFCRITDIDFTLQEFKSFASQPWLNQTYSLNEKDFARILLSKIPNDSNNKFQDLKQLTLIYIYPSLILSIKSLFSNLKESNRLFLKNKFDPSKSPFCQEQIQQTSTKSKMEQKLENQSILIDQKSVVSGNSQIQRKNSIKFPEKSRKQLNYEYALKIGEIDEKYEKKLGCCKKCCYSFFRCLNLVFCNCFNKINGGFKEEDKKIVSKKGNSQRTVDFRLQMRDWKKVAQGAIKELFYQIKIYEEQQQKKLIVKSLRKTPSNIIAIVSRIFDIYGLGALTYNSNVSWFGDSSSDNINGQDTVSGEAFYKQYAFYFWMSFAGSILYGILGRLAVYYVKQNTFGQNSVTGLPAGITHPQFYLAQSLKILNMFFLTVMKSYIDAFVCDYDVADNQYYYMVRDSSIECLSDQHYVYMGFALIGVSIYYPLTTYMMPIFQFNDHSLDLKYRSTYLVVYVQCKLLILGLSSLFANFNSASLTYQLIFATGIMLLIVLFYLRMKPCLLDWFNLIELVLFLIVFFFYIGAIIIIFTDYYLYGLIFSSSAAGLLIIFLISKFIYDLLQQRQREKIGIDDGNQKEKVNKNQGKQDWVFSTAAEKEYQKKFKGRNKLKEDREKQKQEQLEQEVQQKEKKDRELKLLKPVFQGQEVSKNDDISDEEYHPIIQIKGNINEEQLEKKKLQEYVQKKK